jgi:hypothetical protein
VSYDVTSILVAVIGSAASGALGIFNYFQNKRTQILQSKLETEKSKEAARLKYEYDALDKLYKNIEPKLFQFSQSCDDAVLRIYSLVSSTKRRKLGPPEGGLGKHATKAFLLNTGKSGNQVEEYLKPYEFRLSPELSTGQPGTYLYTTIYFLLAPMALFKLLQRQLTMIDLELVQPFKFQYLLAKLLYYSFTQDLQIAQIDPSTSNYEPKDFHHKKNPDRQDTIDLINTDPAKYSRQGVNLATLDITLEYLIEKESVISLSKFISRFDKKNQDYKKADDIIVSIRGIIRHFHPNKKPVLWRILLTQLCLYHALKRIRNEPDHTLGDFIKYDLKSFEEMYAIDRNRVNWKEDNSLTPELKKEVFNQPFEAVKNNLNSRLQEISTSTFPPLTPVTSKDMQMVGYVHSTDNNFITIMQGENQYKIPWSCLASYSKEEVLLKVTKKEIFAFSAGL